MEQMTDALDLKRDEMAEAYCNKQELPTKPEWIRTSGGEPWTYLSYEVRDFVDDAFIDGFNACRELMEHQIKNLQQTIGLLKDERTK